MNRRIRAILPVPAAILAISLASCASTAEEQPAADTAVDTVVVEDARPTLALVQEDGEESLQEDLDVARDAVEVPFSPTAVVTFDIATLDTLDAIGAGSAVVGIPDATLPDYLAEYGDLPKVGSLFEPDFEAVAELEPDLIVTAARSTGQYDALAEIATTIDLTAAYAGTFDPEQGVARAEQLGEIFGHEDEVAEIADRIDQATSELQAEDLGTALVLSVSGGEYGAFGAGSRFGYFYELGFDEAVAAAELPGQEGSPHGDTVTNEFILTADPDWILAFDRGAAVGESASAEEALGNEIVARTTAAQEDRIVYLPASELYIVINGLTAIENVLGFMQDEISS